VRAKAIFVVKMMQESDFKTNTRPTFTLESFDDASKISAMAGSKKSIGIFPLTTVNSYSTYFFNNSPSYRTRNCFFRLCFSTSLYFLSSRHCNTYTIIIVPGLPSIYYYGYRHILYHGTKIVHSTPLDFKTTNHSSTHYNPIEDLRLSSRHFYSFVLESLWQTWGFAFPQMRRRIANVVIISIERLKKIAEE
jgi:hypothetical protein